MHPIVRILADVQAVAGVCGRRAGVAYVRAIVAATPEILRTRSLAAADRLMAQRSWTYSLQGASLELEGRFFGLAREMYCRQVYFPGPAFALSPGGIVVDLGANVGLFSVLAAHAGCKTIAVEAQRGFARELAAWSSSRGLSDRIVVEHALVGPGTGLFADPDAFASASHAEGAPPPILSMSELLAKHRVDRVDFLKVDIEGSEFDLFRSAKAWIGSVRRIAMEVHPEFGSVADLRRTIASHGMTVTLRDADLRRVEALPRECGYLYAER